MFILNRGGSTLLFFKGVNKLTSNPVSTHIRSGLVSNFSRCFAKRTRKGDDKDEDVGTKTTSKPDMNEYQMDHEDIDGSEPKDKGISDAPILYKEIIQNDYDKSKDAKFYKSSFESKEGWKKWDNDEEDEEDGVHGRRTSLPSGMDYEYDENGMGHLYIGKTKIPSHLKQFFLKDHTQAPTGKLTGREKKREEYARKDFLRREELQRKKLKAGDKLSRVIAIKDKRVETSITHTVQEFFDDGKIALYLQKISPKHPISIVNVKLSAHLELAKIYWDFLDPDFSKEIDNNKNSPVYLDVQATLQGLEKSVRMFVTRKLNKKKSPEIVFEKRTPSNNREQYQEELFDRVEDELGQMELNEIRRERSSRNF